MASLAWVIWQAVATYMKQWLLNVVFLVPMAGMLAGLYGVVGLHRVYFMPRLPDALMIESRVPWAGLLALSGGTLALMLWHLTSPVLVLALCVLLALALFPLRLWAWVAVVAGVVANLTTRDSVRLFGSDNVVVQSAGVGAVALFEVVLWLLGWFWPPPVLGWALLAAIRTMELGAGPCLALAASSATRRRGEFTISPWTVLIGGTVLLLVQDELLSLLFGIPTLHEVGAMACVRGVLHVLNVAVWAVDAAWPAGLGYWAYLVSFAPPHKRTAQSFMFAGLVTLALITANLTLLFLSKVSGADTLSAVTSMARW